MVMPGSCSTGSVSDLLVRVAVTQEIIRGALVSSIASVMTAQVAHARAYRILHLSHL